MVNGDAAPHRPTRIGLLAPMRPELRPLLRRLPLKPVGGPAGSDEPRRYTATLDGIELIATTTGIGTAGATQATERLIDGGVDHVIVAGIAGGIGPRVAIGDLVVPETVMTRPEGGEHHPTPLGDIAPEGVLVTSDEYAYDVGELTKQFGSDVVAVDMETGAVGAVCERRGVPWSAFRAISDRADDHTVDPAILGLANPDGSGNLGAVARYVLPRPWRLIYLMKLARDSSRACNTAADAAVAACESVAR